MSHHCQPDVHVVLRCERLDALSHAVTVVHLAQCTTTWTEASGYNPQGCTELS